MLKSILLYVILVGAPLAGLVGILHVGDGLRPPASVAGTWRLEDSAKCLGAEPAELVVEQSGVFLRIATAADRAAARMDEGTFAFETIAGGGACEGRPLRVVGTFGDDGHTLAGRLETDCSACSSQRFSAIKTAAKPAR